MPRRTGPWKYVISQSAVLQSFPPRRNLREVLGGDGDHEQPHPVRHESVNGPFSVVGRAVERHPCTGAPHERETGGERG
jgi:hypothetical protein